MCVDGDCVNENERLDWLAGQRSIVGNFLALLLLGSSRLRLNSVIHSAHIPSWSPAGLTPNVNASFVRGIELV